MMNRIGRSGRFGRKGVGINFVTDEDIKLAIDIAEDAFGVVAARHPELGLK